jgi:hypothetical protein
MRTFFMPPSGVGRGDAGGLQTQRGGRRGLPGRVAEGPAAGHRRRGSNRANVGASAADAWLPTTPLASVATCSAEGSPPEGEAPCRPCLKRCPAKQPEYRPGPLGASRRFLGNWARLRNSFETADLSGVANSCRAKPDERR